jgi:putative ABC transport system substrate-binding protein
MKRREFITLIGGAAAVWPLAAHAQQTRRVGVLTLFADDIETRNRIAAFKRTLATLGWVEGRNIHFDERRVQGDAARVEPVAAEMVGAAPDVILAIATPVLVALQKQTRTVPLVFVNVSDPVDGGFVQSMARPGGNVTGFTSFEYSVGGKWVELLKEVVPSLTRVLVILNPDNYTSVSLLRTIEAVSPAIGVAVSPGRVRDLASIESAIATFAEAPNGGVIVLPDPVTTAHRVRIAEIAVARRLPTIHTFRVFAADGGLMSYGTDNLDLYRRAGAYVDRILKGAKVAEMPVQNPIKYDLIINLKTAKSLGLTVPPIMLTRADEVIE